MCSITHVLPDDFEMTSVSTLASTPKPSAMRNASLTATADTPAIRLLQSLATSPLPTAPTWMMLAPMAASAGRASSRSRASPPTMMASVPSVARGTPPETGASRKRTCLAPSAAAAHALQHAAAAEVDRVHVRGGGQHGDHQLALPCHLGGRGGRGGAGLDG